MLKDKLYIFKNVILNHFLNKYFSQGVGIMILVKAGVINEVFGEKDLDKMQSNILQVRIKMYLLFDLLKYREK